MQIDLLIIAGVLVVAYAALANRLFAFAGPSRDDFQKVASDLMRDPRVSMERKQTLAGLMAGIFKARTAWLLVAFLPVIVVGAARRTALSDPDPMPAELQQQWRRAMRLFSVCVMCTSPAALLIFGLSLALVSFVFSGARIVEKLLGRVAGKIGRDSTHDDFCPPTKAV